MKKMIEGSLIVVLWWILVTIIVLLTTDDALAFRCRNTLISEGDYSLKIKENCEAWVGDLDRIMVKQYGVVYICTLDSRGVITRIYQEIR